MKIQEISPAELEEHVSVIYELILDALTTEGEHHKQWFLEEILKELVGEENYSRVWEDFENGKEGKELWEPGIAP